MSTGHLRIFVVFLVVQVCLLAMMAASWTVQAGPVSTLLSSMCCPWHIAGCCNTATTGGDVAKAKP
ncbi:hypothetical protein E2562_030959 [Oryza meyeriana var. granulata]|uniref:Uncharacterized protein n=1 Tax=Oryza meyeriana var. granulata TaxID=110450 RepID=A0A6G1E4X1_9ORYZ|nr:hypothetical protein E2562_030959 [Oryza meyeriana var. granulata]